MQAKFSLAAGFFFKKKENHMEKWNGKTAITHIPHVWKPAHRHRTNTEPNSLIDKTASSIDCKLFRWGDPQETQPLIRVVQFVGTNSVHEPSRLWIPHWQQWKRKGLRHSQHWCYYSGWSPYAFSGQSRPVNHQLWTETHLQELIFKRQNSSTSG